MKIKIGRNRYEIIIILLFLVLIFSIGLFSTIGTADVSVINTFKIIASKIPFIKTCGYI